MTYAIFGDSYVSRLEKFTNGKLGFPRRCNFFGVPGMSTRRKIHDMFEKLVSYRPRYVFINLGGNDISVTCNPGQIFLDLQNIVNDLYKSGVQRVFVASIIARGKFPLWTGMKTTSFNRIRKSINRKLKKQYKNNYVDIEKWLRYPCHYDKDLVHPGNTEGGLKIFKYEVLNTFCKTLK